MVGSWGLFLISHALTMLSMFSIGMMVGGVAPNVKIAGVIASLLYFPMLIFSGATLPYEVMPEALQRLADFMPLTQGIKLLQATSLGLPIDGVLIPIIVMIALTVICTIIAIKFFRWE
jgi:ABC-2 type transport system permease protein